MNNDDGVEETDSLTSSLFVPVCTPFLSLHLPKAVEWLVKQRLHRGPFCSLVWYLIREDEVLQYTEMKAVLMLAGAHIKLNLIELQMKVTKTQRGLS